MIAVITFSAHDLSLSETNSFSDTYWLTFDWYAGIVLSKVTITNEQSIHVATTKKKQTKITFFVSKIQNTRR